MYNSVDEYTLRAWGIDPNGGNDPVLKWAMAGGWGYHYGDDGHPAFLPNPYSPYDGLPSWVTRYQSGNAYSALELLRTAYRAVNGPDARGRLPWGTEGFPLSSDYGDPAWFNALPRVRIDGKEWNRVSEPLGVMRDAEGGIYKPVMDKVPVSLDNSYDPQYGYIVPTPIYMALTRIAAQHHAGGGWSDMLPGIVMSFFVGLTLGPALQQAMSAWSNGASFADFSFATDFGGGGYITDIPGGGMGDWFYDDSIYASGSDYWDYAGYDTIDYTGYDTIDYTGYDYDSGWYDDGAYVTGSDNWTPGSADPMEYVTYDSASYYDDSVYKSGSDSWEAKYTPEKLSVADIEDADMGKAMNALKTSNGGFDLAKAAQKVFKDNAGRLYKMIMTRNAQGQNVVRQVPVTLPNGQPAVQLANGQVVPMNQSGISPLSSLPSWAIPAALGVGVLLFAS